MINYVIKNAYNPMADIKVDLGTDQPLWKYVMQAIQDLESFNVLNLYKVDSEITAPFIRIGNWRWNPYPAADQIQHRRRETGDKLSTKSIKPSRLGILEFDIYYGGRDKNKNLVTDINHNVLYVPIEDERGRYLIENTIYTEYQLVDKLLYPSGKDSVTLKSLLPIVIKYDEVAVTSIDGHIYSSKIGMVKIFTTMEPILSCFMHIPCPLCYLGVFPILQFCDTILDDKDEYDYFQPIENVDIYVKGYKKGLDKFDYVRTILAMSLHLIEKHKPSTLEELNDPKWWIYQLSYYDNIIEHRGACHQMHVARMLDTISANVLPIPEIDKRDMVSLLRYVLQTEFVDINIYSYENKRLRLNEAISTIITADVSDKLKRMFKFGVLIKLKDMQAILKFHPALLLRNIYKLGICHVTDFTNDLDYYQLLRFTKNGPNSLGRIDKHKINVSQRIPTPTMMGIVDLLVSSKDVGQSGMISPYADLELLSNTNIYKYPNVKWDLFNFIQENFDVALAFNATNIQEYTEILDRLVISTYSDIIVNIPEQEVDES